MAKKAKNAFDAAAERGLKYVKDHPELSFDFSLYSVPGTFPPMVEAANKAAQDFDNEVDGNEGFSGAGYVASFDIFIRQAKAQGYTMYETPATKTLTVRAPGAPVPKGSKSL